MEKSSGLNSFWSTLLAGSILIAGCFCLSNSKLDLRQAIKARDAIEREPLYLPDTKRVRLATFGFNTFASDLLWFTTINYFGKQHAAGKDFHWLNHMCTLVTDLDPQKDFAFEFCGTLLSWEAHDFQAAHEILSKAVAAQPLVWRFWYLRGFNSWYFRENNKDAAEDLTHASTLPEAPPFLASLGARLLLKERDPQTAARFLQDLIRHASNETQREALIQKLKELEAGKLHFKGKTARTGALSNEFKNSHGN